jgi:hypothetical protein
MTPMEKSLEIRITACLFLDAGYLVRRGWSIGVGEGGRILD